MMKAYASCFVCLLILMIHQTVAQTACAAEANFQGCKTIQETRLSSCGPVDFSCQCTAHRLIQECYNLCPGYATDASIHDGTVQSICGAVPTTSSSLPLPSATSLLPSAPASSSIPSSSGTSTSPSPSQKPSAASSSAFLYMPLVAVAMCGAIAFISGI
ncbi:hypothetical protein [Absidia glauca]|uniref:Extracellular membrane protein CFEM domain-containing protein n=1 Tax=Absidia glauca TaxID=4829 RepID=A0A168RHG6_ABSGL|nr:hypothetical protein [Absidia glauca]